MCAKGARDVSPPVAPRKPSLSGGSPISHKRVSYGKLPAPCKLERQRARGVVSPAEQALSVRRDENEAFHRRRGDRLADELGRGFRQYANPSLLPGGHDRASAAVVEDGGARRCEREPAAAALAAALDRPGGRRAAAGAH